ncbi:MAG: hypothetical protein P1V81_08145 [Planctomycetota bacterium]|nr:hypothetical protein [Planctomycetota bacterium]
MFPRSHILPRVLACLLVASAVAPACEHAAEPVAVAAGPSSAIRPAPTQPATSPDSNGPLGPKAGQAAAKAQPKGPLPDSAPSPEGSGLTAWNVLSNGDFEAPTWSPAKDLGTTLPWWRSLPGQGAGYLLQAGALHLRAGEAVSQTAWYWPPSRELGDGFVLRGRARGGATVALVDAGGTARFPLPPGEGWQTFRVTGADAAAELGRELGARFQVVLEGPSLAPAERTPATSPAGYDDVELFVDLPNPEPDAFALELLETTTWILELWTQRGLDRLGPRETSFPVQVFDVVTGESLGGTPASIGVLQEGLLELYDNDVAARLAPEAHAAWRALLEAQVPEFLELSIHPETHLPRLYDPASDEPLDERPIEASRYLRFLTELANHGPLDQRAAALAAAIAMGDAAMRGGSIPTGEVAGRYRPSTGIGDTALPSIRKLDMPAELARLAAQTGDMRYLDAALGALSEYEFLHMWGGTWDSIDPGLDDFYGHFGNRSVTMARAFPDEPMLLRLAATGLDYYGPRWRHTLAHGAFVAADQVRGWEGFVGVAELDAARRAEVAELIQMAVLAHLKGELDADGRWVDVSHSLWEPRFGLEVGDVPGVPGNLLSGLALAHELAGWEGSGEHLDQAFLRASFLAVLRSTRAEYGRPFGLLPSRSEAVGANPSGAELRLLPTLVHFLEQL